jgi:hypothetical protein
LGGHQPIRSGLSAFDGQIDVLLGRLLGLLHEAVQEDHSLSTQNSTRAMRLCGKLLRTSQISRPSERTRGIPIGHENSTSLINILADNPAIGGIQTL